MTMIRLSLSFVLFLSLVFLSSFCTHANYSPCFQKNISSVPHDHLLYKKTKPLVIGHRGNPMKYQGNTLEGFKSLLETNADGFEVDIYLTKDDKLVAFHDDNTQSLTGVNKTVWEMTADELTNLTIKDSLTFGPNTYTFSGRPHIPLLIDVLMAMNNSGKIMFLEIKPNHAINFTTSSKAGQLVAKMVTDLGLVNQASITSFDPIKVRAAHQKNPGIPTGMFYMRSYWDTNCKILHDAVRKLPEMKECPLINATDCESFMKGVFETGDVLKAVNASFLDMEYKIYDNPLYSNHTFDILRKNYSRTISAGAWVMYSMALKKDSTEALDQDSVIDRLMKIGVERFITDDVYRLLSKLGRLVGLKSAVISKNTTSPANTSANPEKTTANPGSTTANPANTTANPTSSSNTTAHPLSSAVREMPSTSYFMTAFLFFMYGTSTFHF